MLPDQPALRGVLDKGCDLGLTVVLVRRLPPAGDPDAEGDRGGDG